MYVRELHSQSRSNICAPVITTALFSIVKKWKQPKYPSTHESMKCIKGGLTQHWILKELHSKILYATPELSSSWFLFSRSSPEKSYKSHTVAYITGGQLRGYGRGNGLLNASPGPEVPPFLLRDGNWKARLTKASSTVLLEEEQTFVFKIMQLFSFSSGH